MYEVCAEAVGVHVIEGSDDCALHVCGCCDVDGVDCKYIGGAYKFVCRDDGGVYGLCFKNCVNVPVVAVDPLGGV